MYRHITLVVLCLTAFAACAGRGELGFVALKQPGTEIERIFIATTRQRSETPYNFNGLRTSELTYGRYDISLPPTHQVGKIEWPKGEPNAATDFVITEAKIFETPAAFRSGIKTTNQSHHNKNETVVFIHGYNNNFAESLYRFSQISADMDLRGTSVLYAWPATENTFEYLHDRDSVLFARNGLQTLLEQLARSGSERLILVAHSIGSMLLMETLRQLALSNDKSVSRIIKGVVLISPDIDETVFKIQLSSLDPVPDSFIVFSDDKDRALKFMSFLTGRRNRLGQITNPEDLKKYDVQVINLSEYTDGDGFLNHSVAITSPSVIAILRKLQTTNESLVGKIADLETRVEQLFKNNSK